MEILVSVSTSLSASCMRTAAESTSSQAKSGELPSAFTFRMVIDGSPAYRIWCREAFTAGIVHCRGQRSPRKYSMDDEVRMETLRVEISARLRNICGDMSDSDFAIMVESIMLNARKSETRTTTWG